MSKTTTNDHSAYIATCQERLAETDYLAQRGISMDVARRMGVGYDPAFAIGTGADTWAAIIIPVAPGSYVARNTDPHATPRNRYRNVGPNMPYHTDILSSATQPVWVVEGEIDALAIMSVGGEAVALGSASNVRQLVDIIRTTQPTKPLIIALDDDASGCKASKALCDTLTALEVPHIAHNPYGTANDAGEAIIRDRDALARTVAMFADADDVSSVARAIALEAYQRCSAGARLQAFCNGIIDSVDTPCIPTGFVRLDACLGGGLCEGLHILGAVSSLGKTTLAMQIADQIAQAGNDVLVFSLEMSSSQLIAKSISRHTIQIALANGIDTANAKTSRGITTGARYVNYTPTEQQLIKDAITAYSQYAGHIYIYQQAVGERIGVGTIADYVAEHIRITGRRPVVIVDYLQIVAPQNDRADIRANTDANVTGLKNVSVAHKIPIIAITSYGRANYQSQANLASAKESGGIEYGADVLLGLQYVGVGKQGFDANDAAQADPRQVELICLKNREGRVGEKIRYRYYPMFNYFREEEGDLHAH